MVASFLKCFNIASDDDSDRPYTCDNAVEDLEPTQQSIDVAQEKIELLQKER